MDKPTSKQLQEYTLLSEYYNICTRSLDGVCRRINFFYQPYHCPAEAYEKLNALQKIWQKLIFAAANDKELLLQTFKKVREKDLVIQGLIGIYQQQPQNQPYKICFIRNDYFLNKHWQPKLVEFGTLAISMSTHSQHYSKIGALCNSLPQSSPDLHNQPSQCFVQEVLRVRHQKKLEGIFIMVTIKRQTNVFEQKYITIRLKEKGLKALTLTFQQLSAGLSEDKNNAYYEGELISFVYYRCGYLPLHYQQCEPASEGWRIKRLLQRSTAIKIPDIAIELVNQKRMQAELSKQAVYSRYLSEEQCSLLQQCLVGIWEFDSVTSSQMEAILIQVRKKPQNYILKPNKQGGGNNIYGKECLKLMEESSIENLQAYILMERIEMNSQPNFMLKDEALIQIPDAVYEISRFGLMSYGQEIEVNECVGYLIRGKSSHDNQGGILAGKGCLCRCALT